MPPRREELSVETDRLIRIGALVVELWEEVTRGQENSGDAGDGGRDDSPHYFSD